MTPTGFAYADTRNMYTAHIFFRREFGLLPDLVRSVAPGDAERAKVVADHAALLRSLIHHHHQAEDEILWPLLLARAPKEVDPVVHLAEGHHEHIGTLLSGAGAPLADWAGGADPEDGAVLALALQELAVVLFGHMSLEEQLVLPVVERHVLASEWAELEERALGPVAPRDVPLVLGMALYEGDEEIVPEPLRADLLPVAPQAYADYAERVYGTRTPPRARDAASAISFHGERSAGRWGEAKTRSGSRVGFRP